jgi:hypothetical protein
VGVLFPRNYFICDITVIYQAGKGEGLKVRKLEKRPKGNNQFIKPKTIFKQ